MADRVPRESDEPRYAGADDGWTAMSHILSGVVVWGGAGWLLDAWLDTQLFVAVGLVIGAAAGVGLVWLRYSKQ